MSTAVIEETGEVIETMTEVEAERITSRIADKLDAIADNLEQVLPLIGEALTRDAWKALGYASPSAYVSERFTGSLSRLAPEVRRPVVAQLSAAGMSTRAIAPIVGTSDVQVHRDVRATATSGSSSDSPRTVNSLDGKTRTYPAPSAPSPEPASKPAPRVDMASNFEQAITGMNLTLSIGDPQTDLTEAQRQLAIRELERIINRIKGEEP